jgi:hypothetical protein
MSRGTSRFGRIFRRKLLSTKPGNALVQGALAAGIPPGQAPQSTTEF